MATLREEDGEDGLVLTMEGCGSAEHAVSTEGRGLTLVLEENGSTGFVWQVSPDTTGVVLEADERRCRAGVPEGAIGAAYDRVLRFTAPVERAAALISLVMSRPWEEEPPAQTVRIRVIE